MTVLLGSAISLAAVLGAPLFTIFGAIALLCFAQSGINPEAVIIELYRMASAPTLAAIPMFTFTGYILAESRAPERIVNLAKALVGWMPAGLAIVCLFACAFFTAFTGASGVTIIALGGLLFPILTKRGYPEKFSLGLITSCGSLGLLFPPSLPLILYGVVGKVDVSHLFMGGLLPGIFLIVILGFYSLRVDFKSKIKHTPFSCHSLWLAFQDSAWEIPLPIIVIVGIYGGFVTATEAAAVTAFYAFVVEVLIHRDVKFFTDLPRIIKESMLLVGGILIILGVALGFTSYLIDAQVPMMLLKYVQSHISSPFTFLIILNVFLLVTGCLLDIFSAIIVIVPLISPLALSYGIDPVHLGIIFLTNLEIGYLTPPVGLNLFISSYRFDQSILHVARVCLPFLSMLLAALLVITYVPQLTLFLVELYK